MRRVYFDYNATTPVHPQVREAILPFLGEEYGNPSSVHAVGARARKALDDARESVARHLKCGPREIVFTSGGTEANHLAIRGAAAVAFVARGRRPVHVVTTAVEHSSVLKAFQVLEDEGQAQVTRLGVDSLGRVDFDALRAALRDDTALVSVQSVNNETGNVYPVAEIGRLCRERGVLFHTDAVQALGKIPVDLSNLPVDLASFSAHKIYGPKGSGALFVRKGIALSPLMPGVQEMEKRAGTENLPGIAGFAAAVDLVHREPEKETARLDGLRGLFQQGLVRSIDGVRFHGDPDRRVANTLNVSFDGIADETLLLSLDREGICVSSGSACASGAVEASHVLLAMGVPKAEAKGAIRFSLGRGSSEHDLEYVLEKLPSIVGRLRGL
ncbi:MAG TPA: cysteine desulfurase family protein [bacterium]|nr:cysteine desulfurase family protein [bacterium]